MSVFAVPRSIARSREKNLYKPLNMERFERWAAGERGVIVERIVEKSSDLGELRGSVRLARCMRADLLQDEFDSAAGFLAVHVQRLSALQARDRRRGVSLCGYCDIRPRDRKSTLLNSSHQSTS